MGWSRWNRVRTSGAACTVCIRGWPKPAEPPPILISRLLWIPSWLVLRAGPSAVPYLLRLHDWNTAGSVLERVLQRDRSHRTVATVLPMLRHLAEAVRGTEQELAAAGRLAQALSLIRAADAETHLRGLLAMAVSRGHFAIAAATNDLVNLAIRDGRLQEALTLNDRGEDYIRRASLGRWTQLGNQATRLQILLLQGHSEEVLAAVHILRRTMATLPEGRETVLDAARRAALDLERWEEAMALNAELVDSRCRRDASRLDQADARFDDCIPLMRLGSLNEAKEVLFGCQ